MKAKTNKKKNRKAFNKYIQEYQYSQKKETTRRIVKQEQRTFAKMVEQDVERRKGKRVNASAGDVKLGMYADANGRVWMDV